MSTSVWTEEDCKLSLSNLRRGITAVELKCFLMLHGVFVQQMPRIIGPISGLLPFGAFLYFADVNAKREFTKKFGGKYWQEICYEHRPLGCRKPIDKYDFGGKGAEAKASRLDSILPPLHSPTPQPSSWLNGEVVLPSSQ
jgi:hypothetical protein